MSASPGSPSATANAGAPPVYALVSTAAPPRGAVVLPLAHAQTPSSPAHTHTHTQAAHSPSSSTGALRQFQYTAEHRGRTVAVLTLSARAAYSREHATFLGREPITGTVRLQLDRPTVVKSISVSITGRCKPRTGADNLFDNDTTFLDISHTVWAATDTKDRRGILGPPGAPAGGGALVGADGRLQGEYQWTFAIELPSAVVAPSQTGAAAYAALERLCEGKYATAVYSVAVRVQREWSAPDYKIKASIAYIPVAWPPPLPLPAPLPAPPAPPASGGLKRTASVAPAAAHDRWHALAPVRILGTLNARPVEVGCTLFLAKPLNYTRGSLIPLCLRLAGADPAALAALSAPRAIAVRLRRRGALAAVAHRSAGGGGGGMGGGLLRTVHAGDAPLEVGAASWADAGNAALERAGEYVRYVAGELHVDAALKPSSAKIEYAVVLYPFVAPEMAFAGGERDAVLREQLVDIDEAVC